MIILSCAIIKELFNCVNSEFWGYRLVSSCSAESHEESDIDSPGIENYAFHNMLHIYSCSWIILW